MPLLFQGKLYETPGLETVPPRAGLTWPVGQSGTYKRRLAISQMVWHWTAGEGDEKGCFRVLSNRGLSVQLFNRADGVIFQYMDLDVVCAHAGKVHNPRSIGIEQQNVGHGKPSAAWPRKRVLENIHGKAVPTSQFYPAQIKSALKLRKHLQRIVPTLGPIHTDPRTTVIPVAERMAWKGDVMHYQIALKKRDPGVFFAKHLTFGYDGDDQ